MNSLDTSCINLLDEYDILSEHLNETFTLSFAKKAGFRCGKEPNSFYIHSGV